MIARMLFAPSRRSWIAVRSLCVSLIALASCAGAPASSSSPSRAAALGPPTFEALLALVRARGEHRFDGAAIGRGCPAEQSLGEYLQTLERNARESEVRRFAGGCESVASWARTGIDPAADPRYWACRIEAYASDRAGESPWRYELRLRVHRESGQIDLAQLACPGGS